MSAPLPRLVAQQKAGSFLVDPLFGADFFKQLLEEIDRYRVRNSAWFLDDRFLGFLDEYFIDNTDDLSTLGIIELATTVTWVGGSIELKDVIKRGKPH